MVLRILRTAFGTSRNIIAIAASSRFRLPGQLHLHFYFWLTVGSSIKLVAPTA